jgi:phenylpyruvate tautomerase PptA (4-oxalocrotonate tautomerase family)
MPVYTCTIGEHRLTADQKATVAAEITRIHSAVTGAPTSFVHVVFHEVPAGDIFTGARPSDHLLVAGLTRGGRADVEKQRLAVDISAACSRATEIPEGRILVTIAELPARFAVEGGRILPEPGLEGDWMQAGDEKDAERRHIGPADSDRGHLRLAERIRLLPGGGEAD